MSRPSGQASAGARSRGASASRPSRHRAAGSPLLLSLLLSILPLSAPTLGAQSSEELRTGIARDVGDIAILEYDGPGSTYDARLEEARSTSRPAPASVSASTRPTRTPTTSSSCSRTSRSRRTTPGRSTSTGATTSWDRQAGRQHRARRLRQPFPPQGLDRHGGGVAVPRAALLARAGPGLSAHAGRPRPRGGAPVAGRGALPGREHRLRRPPRRGRGALELPARLRRLPPLRRRLARQPRRDLHRRPDPGALLRPRPLPHGNAPSETEWRHSRSCGTPRSIAIASTARATWCRPPERARSRSTRSWTRRACDGPTTSTPRRSSGSASCSWPRRAPSPRPRTSRRSTASGARSGRTSSRSRTAWAGRTRASRRRRPAPRATTLTSRGPSPGSARGRDSTGAGRTPRRRALATPRPPSSPCCGRGRRCPPRNAASPGSRRRSPRASTSRRGSPRRSSRCRSPPRSARRASPASSGARTRTGDSAPAATLRATPSTPPWRCEP